MQVIKYAFQQHGDDRGMLVALEEYKDIPFEIKRVYYMYDTKKNVHRGFHAHKSLEQILICIHGSCKVLLDNGTEKKIVSLEKPYEGLYIANNMWREMYDFSEDAVLMVLASEYYKEEDYIRDYNEFLRMVGVEKYAANSCSNCVTRSPRINQPASYTERSAFFSSASTSRCIGSNDTNGICGILWSKILYWLWKWARCSFSDIKGIWNWCR